MKKDDDVRVINVSSSTHPSFAVKDALLKSADAIRENPKFFNDPQHQDRVAQVQAIVENFFPVCKGVYVNQRANRGNPFTVVKVDSPAWPRMSARQTEAVYRKPLRDLGVEIVFSARTNSYIYRVR